MLTTYIQSYSTGWNISDGWIRSSPDAGASWSGPTRINLQPGLLGRPPLAEPPTLDMRTHCRTVHATRVVRGWV